MNGAVREGLFTVKPGMLRPGDCDLAEVKETCGDRICIMGNYNPVAWRAHRGRDH